MLFLIVLNVSFLLGTQGSSEENIFLKDESFIRKENTEEEEVTCIDESKLNFTALKMIKNDLTPDYTIQSCVKHCLQHRPEYEYVLISYADDFFSPDDFKCMCAHKEAFKNTNRLPEYKCSQHCPESNGKYR